MIEPIQIKKKLEMAFQFATLACFRLDRLIAILSVFALYTLAVIPSFAQELRVGLAAPLSGGFAPLGQQFLEGAKTAANNKDLTLIVADDQCSADGGRAAAQKFVQESVVIALGFHCTEALEAALPILAEKNIAILTTSTSGPTLTERRSGATMPVFRVTTGLEKEMQTTGSFLASLWRSEPFAIIDDGTIEGRVRAAHLLNYLKEQQLEPVFTDTYRPGLENQNALVARLRRAGATHVYVGGERDDIAAISASSDALNYPLVVAGGSMLNAAPGPLPLKENTLMIAPLNPLDLPSAGSALDALRQAQIIPDANAVRGYAILELAALAAQQSQKQNRPIISILYNDSFETALGTLKFDHQGTRTDNPNRLQRYDGKRFKPADR